MHRIAADVWMGSGTAVNWVVVREGSDLLLIDSGWPGDIASLEASVAQAGLTTANVTAVLLTHAHIDHLGGVNELWRRHKTPVYVHPGEVAIARGETLEQATPVDVIKRSWRPRTAVWGLRTLAVGALRHPVASHAQAWSSDGPLDLPGRPIPVPCPGHTSGHCAYLFPDQGLIATGDSLVTGHPVSKKRYPHLLPSVFNTSTELARTSLADLSSVDADTIVPGHGPVWSGSIRSAVDLALAESRTTRSAS